MMIRPYQKSLTTLWPVAGLSLPTTSEKMSFVFDSFAQEITRGAVLGI